MLDRILSRTELKEFTTVIDQAVSQGAGAARYYSEASGVIVIAIMTDGGLETWFASPARNNVEAYRGASHRHARPGAGQPRPGHPA
jgi:hypothetical protein